MTDNAMTKRKRTKDKQRSFALNQEKKNQKHTETMKCRIAINFCSFTSIHVSISGKLDSLSCSFTSIFFLTN